MLAYIVRRLVWIAVTLLGVSMLTFGIIFAGPTDAAQALSGGRSPRRRRSSSSAIAAVRAITAGASVGRRSAAETEMDTPLRMSQTRTRRGGRKSRSGLFCFG